MKRKVLSFAGFFGVMFYVGFLVVGCGGVNVHMATPGQDDNLMTDRPRNLLWTHDGI